MSGFLLRLRAALRGSLENVLKSGGGRGGWGGSHDPHREGPQLSCPPFSHP